MLNDNLDPIRRIEGRKDGGAETIPDSTSDMEEKEGLCEFGISHLGGRDVSHQVTTAILKK